MLESPPSRLPPARRTRKTSRLGSSEIPAPRVRLTTDQPPRAPDPDRFYAVGRILAPWGIRGDLVLHILSDNPERFRPGATVYLGRGAVTVERFRRVGGRDVVKLSGVNDRTQAEGLRGRLIEVREADLMELPPDVYFEHDVLGLDARTPDGEPLGKVVDILKTGSNDVYVIRGKREYLIPAIGEVIKEVDLSAGRIVVERIPGLLD